MDRRTAVLAVLLDLVLATACGPSGPLPGGPFPPGSEEAPTDWSFTDSILEVGLETRSALGFRYTITTVILSDGRELYVPSRNGGDKRWVANAVRDPRVRVRIDGRVYERIARRVTDAEELAPLGPVFLRKYLGVEVEAARFDPSPRAPGDERAELWFFRLDPPAAEGARS